MDELLIRQLPHSVEAEQAVLGAMLIDARCVPTVIEHLQPEDFYLRQNKEIYESIYSMFSYSATIDPVTVLEKMRQNGTYDENQSRGYILQLMEVTPTAANVMEYVNIVKDKSLAGGPLNQYSTIGYKLETNGATILYPERVLRVMSCSTYSGSDEAN